MAHDDRAHAQVAQTGVCNVHHELQERLARVQDELARTQAEVDGAAAAIACGSKVHDSSCGAATRTSPWVWIASNALMPAL